MRLVVPGWYGMTNVKWLSEIAVLTEPYAGYQVATAYRFRQSEDEEGRPVTRMRPRSLMVAARDARLLLALADRGRRSGPARGPRVVGSRADRARRGQRRRRRELGRRGDRARPRGALGLVRLVLRLGRVAPGEHVLCCRATDETGDAQPLEPEWNLGGYENNAVQRVPVLVR